MPPSSVHHFQTSSSPRPLGQSKLNLNAEEEVSAEEKSVVYGHFARILQETPRQHSMVYLLPNLNTIPYMFKARLNVTNISCNTTELS